MKSMRIAIVLAWAFAINALWSGCGSPSTNDVVSPPAPEVVSNDSIKAAAAPAQGDTTQPGAGLAGAIEPKQESPVVGEVPAVQRPGQPALERPRALRPNSAGNQLEAGTINLEDFEGKRIGLVHTANVMGEIDPCG